jgi:hypothetical protein
MSAEPFGDLVHRRLGVSKPAGYIVCLSPIEKSRFLTVRNGPISAR